MQGFFEGCRDQLFWTFVDVTYCQIWEEAENERHWGMACCCKKTR